MVQCARHWHQLARVQQLELFVTVLMTMMIHHAQQAQTLCVAGTMGETGTVVRSANLTFFILGSASDTERDILSCASLTRALRSTSEDMAWMIRALHRSVWSREGTWITAAYYIQECTHIWPAPLSF